MSQYPENIDDDSTLPPVNDNLSQIGEVAINDIRDAIINIETFVGTGPSNSLSLAQRLGILVAPDGYFNFNTLTSMGLLTLPIYNSEVAFNAGIDESKLNLNYSTIDLYNYILNLSAGVNIAEGWINVSGTKLEPHLIGALYRHDLNQIDVAASSDQFLDNVFRVERDNFNAYTAINDLNNELLNHQWSDGYVINPVSNIITNGGESFPSNYAHVSSGIYVNSSEFENIPKTVQDGQAFADYIDSNIFSLETTIQNLFANGISRDSSSSILTMDGYGQAVIPTTPCTAYLSTMGSPLDSYYQGDDIIVFNPVADGYLFDSQFALVRVGDILKINYGSVEVAFVIKEKKYFQQTGSNTYAVRIAGKNLFNTVAIARIDRPLYNNVKQGVLATVPVNGTGSYPASLIVGNPQGAQIIGINFNPSQFDTTHYNLYLELYPFGKPNDGYAITLPPIDVTRNMGATAGQYTLQNIVNNTNLAFRQPGFNYRFIAFAYQGQFGIMLADSINNASFSIISFAINASGPDSGNTAINYSNNVIDITSNPDPLGLGFLNANVASPPYSTSYPNDGVAYLYPTRIFVPLKNNNFYLNGEESSTLSLPNTIDGYQLVDSFGDGYWLGTITEINDLSGRTAITYTIPFNLNVETNLAVGKTIVVQTLNGGTIVDAGRFIITSINVNCGVSSDTIITVYDGIHATGVSPSTILPPAGMGTVVAIYFSSDSVIFNAENASDDAIPSIQPIKRYFEIYIDNNKNTYPLERARFFNNNTVVNTVNIYGNNNFADINILNISPTLRGAQYNFTVNKITLQLLSYNPANGIYTGNLCQYTGTVNNAGSIITGKVGTPTRFYDPTNIDYIDFIFDNTNIPMTTISSPVYIDIQLFPTLALDKEEMMIANCQLNTTTQAVDHFVDQRQFGNISTNELSTSAIDYIAQPTQLLNENGVVRGFDNGLLYNSNSVIINGGVAVINGKIVEIDNSFITFKPLIEAVYAELGSGFVTNSVINWFICVNKNGEIELIASTDYAIGTTMYGSLDNTRLFYVVNNAAPMTAPYVIRATYFADLIANQKDVVVLYMAQTTTVAANTFVSNIQDFRRYTSGGYGGLSAPFILSNNGSFRTLASVNNWLVQLNNLFSATNTTNISPVISNKVIVRGTINVDMFILTQILNYNNLVNFVGENGTFNITTNIGITIGSNVSFDNCNFIYNYNGTSMGGYSSADLVNATGGLFYNTLTLNQSITNLTIKNCTFFNVFADHFPFICITATDATAYIGNINIFNNKFISQTPEDLRAAIALISLTGSTPNYPLHPALVNVNISNNICNQNQMIIVSTNRNGNIVSNNAFTATNCFIEKNICGTIGFFTSVGNADGVNNNSSFNANFTINDKFDNLIIKENTCKYISNLDSTGKWIDFFSDSGIPTVTIGTGQVDIINNTTSWIHAGVDGYTVLGEGIRILDNKLNPNNNTYLTNYKDPLNSIPDNIALYLLQDGNLAVGNTQSIISGNIVSQNPIFISGDPAVQLGPYYYDIVIYAGNNAQIVNNNISGVVSTTSGFGDNKIIFLNSEQTTANYVVKGNVLNRNGLGIAAYIYTTASINEKATATITNNYFDSEYIDVANSITNNTPVLLMPRSWVYNNNTNQVAFTAIPFYSILSGAALPSNQAFKFIGAPANATDTLNANSSIQSAFILPNSSGNFNLLANVNLSSVLPQNTQLLYATLGLFNNTNNADAIGTINVYFNSFISMVISGNGLNAISNPIAPSNPGTISSAPGLAGSLADIANNLTTAFPTINPASAFLSLSTAVPGPGPANVAAIRAGTVFLLIDMSQQAAFKQVYIGQGAEYVLSIEFNNVAQSGNAEIDLSPIILQYKWN
jgi:hypothetical protein